MGKKHAARQPANSWRAWIISYPTVSKWLKRFDLHKLLDEGGGIVRIPNFLPEHVADGIHGALKAVPEKDWNMTAARQDYTNNNIDHEFWSTKSSKGLEDVLRLFSVLLPDQFSTFSAARYDKSHHIAPHDDRAYTEVAMEGGQLVTCSRDIAVIYYLTKDWREAEGGVLLDLEGGAALVPQYNSAVAFRVPRYHEVTPLTTDRPRLSIFGWFLRPGLLYDLFDGEEQGQQEQQREGSAGSEGGEQDDKQGRSRGRRDQGQGEQHAKQGQQRSEGGMQVEELGSSKQQAGGQNPRALAGSKAVASCSSGTAAAGSKRKWSRKSEAGDQAEDEASMANCKLRQRLLAKLQQKHQHRPPATVSS